VLLGSLGDLGCAFEDREEGQHTVRRSGPLDQRYGVAQRDLIGRGGAAYGLPAKRVRAEVEPDRTLVALDRHDKGHRVVQLAITGHRQLPGHGPLGDRVAADAILARALLVCVAGSVADLRDPLERLETRMAGEDGLRRCREPLPWHRPAGFEEWPQGVQHFEVGRELALDGEGRSRNPEVEVRLRPVAFDRRGKPMDSESDDRSGEKDKDQQLSRNGRETSSHRPARWGPFLDTVSLFIETISQ